MFTHYIRKYGDKGHGSSRAQESQQHIHSLKFFKSKSGITMVVYFKGLNKEGSIPGVALRFEFASGRYVTVPLSHREPVSGSVADERTGVRAPPKAVPFEPSLWLKPIAFS